MTKTVTIVSLWAKAIRKTDYRYDVAVDVADGSSNERVLDLAFAMTNADYRPMRDRFCATSPGDIMILDNAAYRVRCTGYSPISEREAKRLEKAHKLVISDLLW